MSLKVLHVSSGNLFGGVETLLLTLARERNACPEMEPHFALIFEGRLSSELRALGRPATMLGAVQVRFPWTVWRARRRLKALLTRERFDAVVCHMPWNLAVFGPAVRRAGVPLIFWMHDRAEGRHWIERWARLNRPDFALCNSRFTAATLPLLFRPEPPPCEIVYPPVSLSAISLAPAERTALRRDLDTADDAVVIVQVSRMEPYKGHALHLDALARLRDLPRWVCWMVGGSQRPHEAAYLAELQDRARAAGIADRIRFAGERRDVPRLLASADIFCQPNLAGEPFGIVFIEALDAGLPAVATALGGALEIIDETCGRTVTPGDPAVLAEALRQLVSDPALRARLSQAAPARAQSLCRPDVILEKLKTVIQAEFRHP